MRKSFDRSVIAQRAAANRVLGPSTEPVSRNLAIRNTDKVTAPGPVRRTRCAPMTGAMKRGDNSGRTSEWAASQDCKDSVAIDRRWSQTVSNTDI